VIRARGLSRHFGGRQAVAGASFAVEPGEVVGFLGPNGAGKTTTIRMLLGLLRPSAGGAEVDGPVGYLPETFTAYDAQSVGGYVRFMARMKGVAGGHEVDRVLRMAGATELAGRPFGKLSKGQRQRVGLAQALLGRPPAYLLDEPTQGLDPRQVIEVRQLLRRLAGDEGGAVLLSTHVLAEAAAVCDRVVVIVGGRIVAEERPGETADLEARFLRLVGEAGLQ
jgi:ABC-2 type transport system ATP-binding protein